MATSHRVEARKNKQKAGMIVSQLQLGVLGSAFGSARVGYVWMALASVCF